MSLKNIIEKKPLTEQINNTKKVLYPMLEEVSLLIEYSDIEHQIIYLFDENRLSVPDEFYNRLKMLKTLEKKRDAIGGFIDLQVELANTMDRDIFEVNRKMIIHNINYSTIGFNKRSLDINRKINELLLEFTPYAEKIRPKQISYKEIIDAMCQRKDFYGDYSFKLDGFKMTKKLYTELPRTYKPSTQTITVPNDIRESLGLENGTKVFKCDLAEAIAKRNN